MPVGTEKIAGLWFAKGGRGGGGGGQNPGGYYGMDAIVCDP